MRRYVAANWLANGILADHTRWKGETVASFRAFALSLLGRLFRSPLIEHFHPLPWDTFTWLRAWDYDDLAGSNHYEATSQAEQQQGLFPHL